MCVIIIATEEGRVRPNENMVRAAWDKNPDGGGFAERVTNAETGVTKVVWSKGLSLDQMISKCKNTPLPFVAHFRIASKNGGGVLPELCHPFPIRTNLGFEMSGEEDCGVLFHNGDWSSWQDVGLRASFMDKAPDLPEGKWSDTKMLAWLCSFHGGWNFMDLVNQKGVAFGPYDYKIFEGATGWKDIQGLVCSNDAFWVRQHTRVSNNYAQSHMKMCYGDGCTTTMGLINNYCEVHKSQRETKALGPAVPFKCTECDAATGSGQSHKSDCSKSSKRTFECPECKAKPGTDHVRDCSLAVYEKDEPGVSRPTDPFSVAERARERYRKGEIGKKALKKVLKKLGYHGGNRNARNSGLGDPRVEVVTH